jgi:group II intron reverse transcriptase/maturase
VKDERAGGHENLKDSAVTVKKQETPNSGYPEEARVETRGNLGAQTGEAASENGNGDVQLIYTRDLQEWILERGDMSSAYGQVASNKGSHGIGGMKVEQLKPCLKGDWGQIKGQLLEGAYKPQAARRVEIPKPEGGARLLGIPTVLGRTIQQAIAQILDGFFDHTFSESSYGFRKGRSAHGAIQAALEHISEGCEYVAGMDLEKFFGRANHDKLMTIIARRVGGKKLIKLIRGYLGSGIMINGVGAITEGGVAQGGPLSPLLPNIMLDELDKGLEKRGHRFVRYADDCNI